MTPDKVLVLLAMLLFEDDEKERQDTELKKNESGIFFRFVLLDKALIYVHARDSMHKTGLSA